ncbi:MAG TPA: hypothetical protein VK277_02830 [Acidimicrobiales bacterium]|nr:hypothetical protein [Acidimicrobiales bacterium]
MSDAVGPGVGGPPSASGSLPVGSFGVALGPLAAGMGLEIERPELVEADHHLGVAPPRAAYDARSQTEYGSLLISDDAIGFRSGPNATNLQPLVDVAYGRFGSDSSTAGSG